MTELIVALDGTNPYNLACNLIEAGVSWFKVGPQLMVDPDWLDFTECAKGFPDHVKVFLDVKLADTGETCYKAAIKFAETGIAAVSTYTETATEAALEGAIGSELRVWQVYELTDQPREGNHPRQLGHGLICGGNRALWLSGEEFKTPLNLIVPGVRLDDNDNFHRHRDQSSVSFAKEYADYIVVGRPIYQAQDPVAEAKKFLEALKGG